MTWREILTGIVIYLLFPFAGLLGYLKLRKQMLHDQNSHALVIEFFIIFTLYGGLLLVLLTSLFWKWPGLASIGSFFRAHFRSSLKELLKVEIFKTPKV